MTEVVEIIMLWDNDNGRIKPHPASQKYFGPKVKTNEWYSIGELPFVVNNIMCCANLISFNNVSDIEEIMHIEQWYEGVKNGKVKPIRADTIPLGKIVRKLVWTW